MAVVKANAYGHGIIEVAKEAINCGTKYLGVARLAEGIKIRESGISKPILILGYTNPDGAEDIINYDLTQTIYSFEDAKRFSDYSVRNNRKINVHLKIDTGMGRLGLVPDCLLGSSSGYCDIKKEIASIMKLSGLNVEGIFTHFSSSDSKNKSYTRCQFEIFNNIINSLEKDGICIPLRHAANSAALIDFPESHMDLVRPGIAIYGLRPSKEMKKHIDLKPAMTLKSKIVQLKEVPAGFKVSYGSTYTTQEPSVIATVPIGYGDGLSRALSSRGYMLVNGYRVPIVGRVCMDMTMLNVTKIPDVQLGDEVVIFGNTKGVSLAVEEIADSIDTINYEIVTMISNRVERVYVKH